MSLIKQRVAKSSSASKWTVIDIYLDVEPRVRTEWAQTDVNIDPNSSFSASLIDLCISYTFMSLYLYAIKPSFDPLISTFRGIQIIHFCLFSQTLIEAQN